MAGATAHARRADGDSSPKRSGEGPARYWPSRCNQLTDSPKVLTRGHGASERPPDADRCLRSRTTHPSRHEPLGPRTATGKRPALRRAVHPVVIDNRTGRRNSCMRLLTIEAEAAVRVELRPAAPMEPRRSPWAPGAGRRRDARSSVERRRSTVSALRDFRSVGIADQIATLLLLGEATASERLIEAFQSAGPDEQRSSRSRRRTVASPRLSTTRWPSRLPTLTRVSTSRGGAAAARERDVFAPTSAAGP